MSLNEAIFSPISPAKAINIATGCLGEIIEVYVTYLTRSVITKDTSQAYILISVT